MCINCLIGQALLIKLAVKKEVNYCLIANSQRIRRTFRFLVESV